MGILQTKIRLHGAAPIGNVQRILPMAHRLLPLALCRSGGFSLIELMIGVLAGGIVLSATIETVHHLGARLGAQQARAETHQDQRLGLSIMVEEIRLAGVGGPSFGPPILSAKTSEVAFLANVHARSTSLSQSFVTGQVQLTVQQGRGWRKGKRVLVCEGHRCREGRLVRNGRSTTLTLSAPLDRTFPRGSQVLEANYVRYYVSPDNAGGFRLMRQIDGGASSLFGGVSQLNLTYLTKAGQVTTNGAQVARVRIHLELLLGGQELWTEIGLRL